MDVSTRPARPSPVTAHPQGPVAARATQQPSVGVVRPRTLLLRAAVAALILGAVAAVAALEDRASDGPAQFRPPSVDVVPLAP